MSALPTSRGALIADRALRVLKRQLQLWHRWFGIVLSLPILLWFISGAVMIFVAFPRLSEPERRAGLAPLAVEQMPIAADAAAAAADIEGVPLGARLAMLGTRAVWRVQGKDGVLQLVAADGGGSVAATDAGAALSTARDFRTRSGGDGNGARHTGLIEVDQWTINGLRGLQPPLHRIAFADGGLLYVSQRSGEVVRDVTPAEAFWGWPGAVTHWIYLLPLRENDPLWSQVVMWLSGVSCVVAISGLLIGAWRSLDAWRRRRQLSAYRGLHLWHHLLGWAGGLLVVTWLFSGWMSMGPLDTPANDNLFAWRGAWNDAPPAWAGALRAPRLDTAGTAPVEIALVWLAGQPWYRLADRDGGLRWQAADADRDGQTAQPDVDALIAHASQVSGTRIATQQLLDHYDFHYTRLPLHEPLPLPVRVIELDDPQRSRFYISDSRADIVALSDKAIRLDRWLYRSLHSWDFPWLLQLRWLREGLLLLGLALGTALSLTGLILGCRHLQRVTFRRRKA